MRLNELIKTISHNNSDDEYFQNVMNRLYKTKSEFPG